MRVSVVRRRRCRDRDIGIGRRIDIAGIARWSGAGAGFFSRLSFGERVRSALRGILRRKKEVDIHYHWIGEGRMAVGFG